MRKIILIILTYIYSMAVDACSCISEDKSLKDTLKDYAAVFVARPISQDVYKNKFGEYYKYEIEVVSSWKGNFESLNNYLIFETERSSTCGDFSITTGGKYLVFAHKAEGNLFYSGGCSPISDINVLYTKQTIKELNKLATNKK